MIAADDCFAFPERRLLHEEAIALLRGFVVPVPEQETTSVFAAAARVCAEIVKAPRAIPAHTNAAVDGYAFAFEDYNVSKGTVFPIAGRAAAGEPMQSVEPSAGRSAFSPAR